MTDTRACPPPPPPSPPLQCPRRYYSISPPLNADIDIDINAHAHVNVRNPHLPRHTPPMPGREGSLSPNVNNNHPIPICIINNNHPIPIFIINNNHPIPIINIHTMHRAAQGGRRGADLGPALSLSPLAARQRFVPPPSSPILQTHPPLPP